MLEVEERWAGHGHITMFDGWGDIWVAISALLCILACLHLGFVGLVLVVSAGRKPLSRDIESFDDAQPKLEKPHACVLLGVAYTEPST